MSLRRRLLVALVLQGKDAEQVDGLRRALYPRAIERIAPHITLVPPHNVDERDVKEVNGHLAGIAHRSGVIALGLGPVATFAPITPVIYLSVHGHINALQQKAESGPLAPPPDRPQRPYVPHVTIANHASAELIEASLLSLQGFSLDVVIDRLSVFEQNQTSSLKEWELLEEFALAPAVIGRGGRELVLQSSTVLGSSQARFLEHERRAQGEESSDLVISGEVAGEMVVLCRARVKHSVLEVLDLLVGSADRGLGIGTQVLSHLERHAQSLGLSAIDVVLNARSATFFIERGFSVLMSLGGDEELLVLRRQILTDAGPGQKSAS